jgi:hypothetical protein
MEEKGIRPLRATFLVLLSAAALAGLTLVGVRLGHPFLGALGGYLAYLALATRAFRSSLPGADDVVDDGRLPHGRRLHAVALFLVTALLLSGRMEGQSLPFSVSGFVDVAATWNPNLPSDRDSFIPGAGTSGKKANELSLNLAAVEISTDPAPLGFRLVANVGTGTDVVHSGERHPENVRYIYQASVSYKLDVLKGLVLEAGIQPSHIGYEGYFSKDNPNYTRSWMGELSPYYQTGIKAALAVDDHWSGQLWVMNGWQNIEDNNDAKSFGTQIAWSNGPVGVTWNTFAGPELADDNAHWRTFSDLLLILKPNDRLQVALAFDCGRQSRPDASAATWLGAGMFARYATGLKTAFAARADVYDDRAGFISGTQQTLWDGTLTFEWRPHPQLILKIDARYDRSTADVFGGRSGPATERSQPLGVLGAVATF